MKLMKCGSQATKILAHLTRGGTLTPLQALDKFDCLTLSQRCSELRQRGHRIVSRMVNVGGKRVAQYRLERQ